MTTTQQYVAVCTFSSPMTTQDQINTQSILGNTIGKVAGAASAGFGKLIGLDQADQNLSRNIVNNIGKAAGDGISFILGIPV